MDLTPVLFLVGGGMGFFNDFFRDCRKSPRDEFWNIFMGPFTLRDLKIVDSGPFYEVDLFS